MSLHAPALHPSHHIFINLLLSQFSWTDTHLLSSDKGCFHRTDWEVPPQLLNCCPSAPQSPSFTHSTHKQLGMVEGSDREREHRNILNIQLKLNHPNGHSKTCFKSHLWSPTLLSAVHCHPIRGYLLDLSHPFKNQFSCPTKLCWISLFPSCCLFISPCIFI